MITGKETIKKNLEQNEKRTEETKNTQRRKRMIIKEGNRKYGKI